MSQFVSSRNAGKFETYLVASSQWTSEENHSKSKVSTLKFPEDPKLTKRMAYKNEKDCFTPSNHSCVCPEHFMEDSFGLIPSFWYIKQNNSYLNCICRWKWRVIIAVNFNLSNWKEEACHSVKKSGRQQDLNLWPKRYRCDALPTEIWSHTLRARSIFCSNWPRSQCVAA